MIGKQELVIIYLSVPYIW